MGFRMDKCQPCFSGPRVKKDSVWSEGSEHTQCQGGGKAGSSKWGKRKKKGERMDKEEPLLLIAIAYLEVGLC